MLQSTPEELAEQTRRKKYQLNEPAFFLCFLLQSNHSACAIIRRTLTLLPFDGYLPLEEIIVPLGLGFNSVGNHC